MAAGRGAAVAWRSGHMHELLSGPDRCSRLHVIAERKSIRREYDDRRSMLKPAHFFALAEACIAGDGLGPAVGSIEIGVEKTQPDAGDEDRRDGHQRDKMPGPGELGLNDGALVLAEQFLDPLRAMGLTFQVSPEM